MKIRENSKKKILLIMLTIIATILSLFVLSTTVNALKKGELMGFDEVKELGKLGNFARFISYKPNAFFELEVNDIFGLNARFNGRGSGYSFAKEPLSTERIYKDHVLFFWNLYVSLPRKQNNN